MRVISAGDGYKYLLKSVAAGDTDRDLSTPLTRYYVAAGTPPGVWLGSGLDGLSSSIPADPYAPRPGELVTEEQLRRLLGHGRHPVTGEALGRAYPVYRDTEDWGRRRRAVAGYDYTFSVPKSVSTLWALGDGDVQERIVAAHHAAVRDVVALLEREVAATRTGALGTDGAVAQVDVHGLLATAFDHVDSRAGDPQLHTHVVVSNKVQAVHDGKWRSLDGRPMHAATVALSEHYNAVLADHLNRALGVGWERRSRGRDRNPGWEITGIPAELLETFSRRSRDIDATKEQLIADYVDRHGHQPSATTVIKLRAQATLATRPDKQLRSLADLTHDWRQRARAVLGEDATGWTRRLLNEMQSSSEPAIGAAAFSDEDVATLAKRTLVAVGQKRATWRYWNLHAEASRQTMQVRFTSTADRDAVVARVTAAAERLSVRLTADESASVPSDFRRSDGSSMFRPRHGDVFTSRSLLAAEDRLLTRSRTTTGPTIDATTIARGLRRDSTMRRLGVDQRAAVTSVASSGRPVDVLVGPAGTGKTTAMRALRSVWEARHGSGSVVGLAPSAAAADVLGTELGIGAENTAKWWYEHRRGHADLASGQLVILDEASLAGTYTLDAITGHAEQVGAKVLLVGDPSQLGAVDAGGAFGMLADDRRRTGNLPELADVRRFGHRWERTASLGLRDGNTAVIDAYLGHDRIRDGDTEAMTAAVYDAWKRDSETGRSSLMVAETREAVTDLNQRARTDRIAVGQIHAGRQVRLADGTDASAGDVIVTRRNDRRLHAGRRWVRNGDRWQITHIRDDGAIRARRLRSNGRLGSSLLLPAEYAAVNVELGYAATVHRAQGATVDTCHVLVASSSMTREAFYVAMTRGRATNIAYLATDQPDLEPHQHDPTSDHQDNEDAVRRMLTGILNHPGTESSAHQKLEDEQARWGSIAQLAAEYETIANHAQKPRWTRLLTDAGLTPQQVGQIIDSNAYGALATLLRRAESDGHDVARLVPAAVARHGLDDADDPAAVLHHRLAAATARPPVTTTRTRPRPALIAGLIPQAVGPMTKEHRRALTERRALIERRAVHQLKEAIRQREPWVRVLGTPPRDPHWHRTWLRDATTIAAYRDRHQITDPSRPLGAEPDTNAQRADTHRARAAQARAYQLSTENHARWFGRHGPVPPGPAGPRL